MLLLAIGDRFELLAANQRTHVVCGQVVYEVLLPGLSGVPPPAHHSRQLAEHLRVQVAGISLQG